MWVLILNAYLALIEFDVYLLHGNFAALYNKARNCPVAQKRDPSPNTVEQVCYAVEMACLWYWKDVLCLQRSAATTCLLKRSGIYAQMVLGAQHMPFKAHAWVEVEGRVVNDKPHIREMYSVLDRC